MKKSWGLIPKILNGEKTIESRWYMNKSAPWDRVRKGEAVYFKNAGEPVIARAEISRIIQYSDLTANKVGEILHNYGRADGLGIDSIPTFIELFKNKRYCILVFLRNAQRVEPFKINKKGFGIGSAWLTVKSVENLRRTG
jgi:hypothetical protein